jgi:Uma2 family endonuclease
VTDTRVRTEKFTQRDYMQLPEGFPAELIDGDFVREPAPTRWHQHVVLEIAKRLDAAVGSGRVVVSPVDVFVDDWNVLQPDVLVSRPEDATAGSPPGAVPMLAVEVLSPSTACRDRDAKTALYLRAGVHEVWLVDPDAGTVEVHIGAVGGEGGGAGVRRFAAADRAHSSAVPGFSLAWRDLEPPR